MGNKYDELAKGMAPERRERAEKNAMLELIASDLIAISEMIDKLPMEALVEVHDGLQRVLSRKSN